MSFGLWYLGGPLNPENSFRQPDCESCQIINCTQTVFRFDCEIFSNSDNKTSGKTNAVVRQKVQLEESDNVSSMEATHGSCMHSFIFAFIAPLILQPLLCTAHQWRITFNYWRSVPLCLFYWSDFKLVISILALRCPDSLARVTSWFYH